MVTVFVMVVLMMLVMQMVVILVAVGTRSIGAIIFRWHS